MNIYNFTYGKDSHKGGESRENQGRNQRGWENFNRFLKYPHGFGQYNSDNGLYWYCPVWYYPSPQSGENSGTYQNPYSQGMPFSAYSAGTAGTAGAPPQNVPQNAPQNTASGKTNAADEKLNEESALIEAAMKEEAEKIKEVKAAAEAAKEKKVEKPAKPDNTVRSTAEFLDAVEKAYAHLGAGSGGLWFRGTESDAYPLLPPALRKTPAADEEALVARFKTRAAPYICGLKEINLAFDRNSYITALFLMRSAGIPTRILSFTEDALAALFFAVNAKGDAGEPAVWCLDPQKLNIEHGFGVPNAAERKVAELLGPGKNPESLKPCAVYSPFLSVDIIAQKEVFTIFPSGALIKSLETLTDSENYLYKIAIDKNACKTIAEQLERYGFKKENLVRCIDTVAESIKNESRP